MSRLEQILGGSVVGVVIRLVLISILVGVLLSWLNLTPWQLVGNLKNWLLGVYARGAYILRDLLDYFVLGAIVVVPVWILLRLTRSASSRQR